MIATRTDRRILSIQPVGDGGGSEHALIRMIRRLAADGWECHVAIPAPARLAREYAAAGAVVHTIAMERITTSGRWWRWPLYLVRWPGTVGRLWALSRRLRVNVVHSNSLHCWYGWAAAWLAGRPHVWHAREIVFQSGAALRLERRLARRAAAVVAVSSAVADQLDRGNVVVVHDDADRTAFRPDRAGSFRADSGIGDGVLLVGSLARVDVWKGFDTLLTAFPAVRAASPGTELVVAGGPVPGKEPYYESLAARATDLPGVHWLGPRLAGEIPGLLADLDVFVQVSTEPEPYGLVLVEALASGVPVVGGEEGGPRDIVTSPDCGRLVPPGDPDRLAAAVLDLLPPATSTAQRRSRPPLGDPPQADFTGIFAAAIERYQRARRR